MTGAFLQQADPFQQNVRFVGTDKAYGVSSDERNPLFHKWTDSICDIKKPKSMHLPVTLDDWISKLVLSGLDSTVERNLDDESGHDLQTRITDLLKHHRHQDWDGENADPLSKSTVRVACKIAAYFPDRVPTDINATPHGEVDFDWVVDSTTMLTVSVGPPPKHKIAYAAIFDGGRVSGQASWRGTLPRLIRCCFHQLITK